jgi:hypothetical protein
MQVGRPVMGGLQQPDKKGLQKEAIAEQRTPDCLCAVRQVISRHGSVDTEQEHPTCTCDIGYASL